MRAIDRGATAVATAVALALLCAFVALALDVGHLLSVKGELQNGSDSGALAGAKALDGTNTHGELAQAITDAGSYARSHPTDIFSVDPTTIQLGAWVAEGDDCPATSGGVTTRRYGYKFCEIAARTEVAAADITAVRVISTRGGAAGDAGGGPVDLAFGTFVGQRGPATVGAEAIAVAGGPCAQDRACLPFAIRAGCVYQDHRIRCDEAGVGPVYYIGLSPAPPDSAGLTSLSDVNAANGRAACEIIKSCTQATDNINIQDGNDWVAACDAGCTAKSYTAGAASGSNDKLCEVVRKLADQNCDGQVDLGEDGRPAFRARVPVVRYPGESEETCGDGHYNQTAHVEGWATVSIVSARCEQTTKLPFDTAPITAICDAYSRAHGDFSGSTCVAIQLYCDQVDPGATRVGCGWFGTVPLQPVLVR